MRILIPVLRRFNRWLAVIPEAAVCLVLRLSVGMIFWLSGRTKVEGLFTIRETTWFLFEHEYALPLIPSGVAAVLATLAEHLLPLLLFAGLATRLAALGLLTMTAVIQTFVYPDAWPTHALWAAALLALVARGGGQWSLDHWLGLDPVPDGRGPHEAASATGPRKGHPFRPSLSRPAMSEGMTDAASEGRGDRLQAEDPWESLLRSANAGDARAFARFLVAVTPTIQGIVRARARTLTREDRDDLVQEILIAIHLKRRSWQPDRPLRPWLHAVIRYKIIDTLRRRSRQVQSRHLPIEDLDESLFCEDPADPSVPLDLERILARIDERSAFIIRASALDGQQAAAIGEQMALAEGTVRVLLHRALRKLSDLVQRTLP